MNDSKKERIYHRNGFEGEYVFPLRIKPGALLDKEGCENWTTLPWFKTGLVVIILENEGWEYWNELEGRITMKPGWHVEAETGIAMNNRTMSIAIDIAPALERSNFIEFIFINSHLDYISYFYEE